MIQQQIVSPPSARAEIKLPTEPDDEEVLFDDCKNRANSIFRSTQIDLKTPSLDELAKMVTEKSRTNSPEETKKVISNAVLSKLFNKMEAGTVDALKAIKLESEWSDGGKNSEIKDLLRVVAEAYHY